MQKRGLNLWHWKDFLAPALSVRQPLFETSDLVRRVSNAALANAALVLSSKHWKKIRDGGHRRKTNPKSLGFSAAVRE